MLFFSATPPGQPFGLVCSFYALMQFHKKVFSDSMPKSAIKRFSLFPQKNETRRSRCRSMPSDLMLENILFMVIVTLKIWQKTTKEKRRRRREKGLHCCQKKHSRLETSRTDVCVYARAFLLYSASFRASLILNQHFAPLPSFCFSPKQQEKIFFLLVSSSETSFAITRSKHWRVREILGYLSRSWEFLRTLEMLQSCSGQGLEIFCWNMRMSKCSINRKRIV